MQLQRAGCAEPMEGRRGLCNRVSLTPVMLAVVLSWTICQEPKVWSPDVSRVPRGEGGNVKNLILISLKEKKEILAFNSTDEPGGHDKCNKPDRKRQIPYDFTAYLWNQRKS